MTPLSNLASLGQRIRDNLSELIYGQEQAIDLILIGLFSEGHLLLEGVPGTAKTTMVKALAQVLGLSFKRIQLTPDLLPAEIIGSNQYDLSTRSFQFHPGPLFTELLLADEINRTPPKTQAAFLEAMEEHQVTVDGVSYPLPERFTVIATLNPIEFQGTYPLPEAQLDRFLLKITIPYPEQTAERRLLEAAKGQVRLNILQHALTPLATPDDILKAKASVAAVTISEPLLDYLLAIVQETRNTPLIALGASPRAGLSLLTASRTMAALRGRDYVIPEDIKETVSSVLAHRLLLTTEAELDGLNSITVLKQILNRVAIPR